MAICGLITVLENEESWVRVTDVAWIDYGMTLTLAVLDGQYGEATSRWRVRCTEVRELLISDVIGGGLHLHESNHVALRLHSDEVASLYFTGVPKDPLSTIGALYEAHRSICDDWMPIDKYLNQLSPSSQLLAGGHGKLASGPKFLLEKYAEILGEAGVTTRITDIFPAKYWNGGAWVEQTIPLKLLHFGESFVIAEKFDGERLQEPPKFIK